MLNVNLLCLPDLLSESPAAVPLQALPSFDVPDYKPPLRSAALPLSHRGAQQQQQQQSWSCHPPDSLSLHCLQKKRKK